MLCAVGGMPAECCVMWEGCPQSVMCFLEIMENIMSVRLIELSDIVELTMGHFL